MVFHHHDLPVELPDAWWIESGMAGFLPKTQAYAVDAITFPGVFYIAINDIGPVRRNAGVPLLARERALYFLCKFRAGDAIPPVQIHRQREGLHHLYDGTHRLYCSLAAGFSHVPAIDR